MIPYKIYTQFKIEPRPTIYSSRPKLFIQLYSRSNKLPPGKMITIYSPKELYDYFPDSNPHITLQKARLLINAGFNLCVMNAYKSEKKINIRFINNINNNEIITTPYDDLDTESQTTFNLTNYSNSVIKINLKNVKPKEYFILEINSKENNIQSNLLIWFHDKTQEEINNYTDATGNTGETFFIQDYLGISTQYIYFHKGTGISLKDDVPFIFNLIRIIQSCPIGFYSFIGNSYEELFICHNNGFINTANHTKNIEIDLNDSYIPRVLLNTKTSQKVLDIYSLYNTDNNEIIISIEKIKDYIYRLTISKIYEEQIIYQENFIGCTNENLISINKYDRLTDIIQEKSILVGINSYSNIFKLPEGTFFLRNLNNSNDENYNKYTKYNEIDSFIGNLENLKEEDKKKAPIYYDGGLNSLKYQQALYKKFSNTTVLGLFIYRGLEITKEKNNVAFFSDQKVTINNIEYNTCDILITLMTNNNFKSGIIENAINCTETIIKEDWVNSLNSDSIVTNNGIVGFLNNEELVDIKYCILKHILTEEINNSWDFSIDSVMTAINNVKQTFKDVFFTNPDIQIGSYKQINPQGDIKVEVVYRTETITKYDTINITKTVNLT